MPGLTQFFQPRVFTTDVSFFNAQSNVSHKKWQILFFQPVYSFVQRSMKADLLHSGTWEVFVIVLCSLFPPPGKWVYVPCWEVEQESRDLDGVSGTTSSLLFLECHKVRLFLTQGNTFEAVTWNQLSHVRKFKYCVLKLVVPSPNLLTHLWNSFQKMLLFLIFFSVMFLDLGNFLGYRIFDPLISKLLVLM